MAKQKTAIIIGAGPAGLTAAYELLEKTAIKPIVFEASADIGGISKTVNYKGNRIDIGGHRFFSKSDRVMDWWQKILPLQGAPTNEDKILDITYHNQSRPIELKKGGPDPEKTDKVMLIRSRLSRMYFLGHFFDYPVSLSAKTVKNLGPARMIRIMVDYVYIRVFPIKPEKTLEDLYINRFGKTLYRIFFEYYTEKVWGEHPSKISPEWGNQRVKGISVTAVLKHALRKTLKKRDTSIGQKSTETSLIEQFLYPKFGPGQMWETVADIVQAQGGQLHLNSEVVGIEANAKTVKSIVVVDPKTKKLKTVQADYIFSTMPVKDLVAGFKGAKVPARVKKVAAELPYRDFITVGLLLKKMRIKNETGHPTVGNIIPDNWVYMQDREVRMCRFQVFNNWSPYMVKDLKNTVWIGLEYVVSEGDDLWQKSDEEMQRFGAKELAKINVIDEADVLDHTVIRMKKTYPAYFGSYENFDEVKAWANQFENLFLIGRNGMHKYNNQDHSMLTAILAVENIINSVKTKDNIWEVNAEQEYHEEK